MACTVQEEMRLKKLKLIQTQLKKIIRRLHSDQDGEFRNQVITDWADEMGIRMEYSHAHVPAQNGLAEG